MVNKYLKINMNFIFHSWPSSNITKIVLYSSLGWLITKILKILIFLCYNFCPWKQLFLNLFLYYKHKGYKLLWTKWNNFLNTWSYNLRTGETTEVLTVWVIYPNICGLWYFVYIISNHSGRGEIVIYNHLYIYLSLFLLLGMNWNKTTEGCG